MNKHSTLPLRTGRSMPVMGLGTWELTDDTAGTVEEALRLGYRMIDTAVDYGSQPGIGEALRRSAVDRDEVYLVAKVEEDDDAYDATRRYLGEMDQAYADLMLIHRPPEEGVGRALWQGLMRAREDGLARDIGVSNYSTEQIDALVEATGEVPVVNQIEWTPFGWNADMLDYCRKRDIVVQAYSPLTRAERLDDERLIDVAEAYDRTPAQVLLRWALQRGVAPLPKANQREHLVENLGAFDFELSEEHMQALNDLNEHYSALGPTLQYL
jgi:diketogulonate reductase-like aldo/keto reductase